MAYSVAGDVQKAFNADRITSLADDDADGTADTDVIGNLIDDADAFIYSHIRHLYTNLDPDDLTAGTDVPNELRWASSQLAAVFLKRRQGINDIQTYEQVERWLDKVAQGEISLQAATTRLPDSTTRGREKDFSDKSLDNYGEPAPGIDAGTDNTFFQDQGSDRNDFA